MLPHVCLSNAYVRNLFKPTPDLALILFTSLDHSLTELLRISSEQIASHYCFTLQVPTLTFSLHSHLKFTNSLTSHHLFQISVPTTVSCSVLHILSNHNVCVLYVATHVVRKALYVSTFR